MQIDHIALYTGQPEVMVEFYKKYFCASEHAYHQSEHSGQRIWTLHFDKGSALEITAAPGFVQKAPERNVGFAHIAIHVGESGLVDFVTRRLKDDGYSVVGEPRLNSMGMYESCVLDPDGNWVEITG